jgi:TRAP-type C4-dicarboxylate transport system permease small subunit
VYASQVGGSIGLAVLATVASAKAATEAAGTSPADALASGYDRVFLLAAGIGLTIAAVSVLLSRRRGG